MAPFYNFLMKFICITIIILLCISFLNYNHLYPWTTFDGEKNIFYVSTLFFICFIFNHKKKIIIDINILFLFLLFLCSIYLYQFYIFKQYFYIFNLYLINLIALSVVLINIECKKIKLLDFVLTAILISGCLSSLFSIYQWLDFANESFWLYKSAGPRFSANLAQPNHLSTLLLLALLSCVYFFNKIRFIPILFFIPILLFALLLTQSRSAILALILIAFVTVIKWNLVNSKVKVVLFSFLPIYILFGKLLSITNEKINTVERMGKSFERLAIWQDFFYVMPHIGFWGTGWKNIEYYQFEFGQRFSGYLASYHNIFLDLIVIFGLLGGLFFLYVFFNLLRIFVKLNDQNDCIVFLMILVIINHSLLEFPLFYTYFLFVFTVFYFSLVKKYPLNIVNLKLNKPIFSFFVILIMASGFIYNYIYEKNRSNYRTLFLGYCVKGVSENFLFDEFYNLTIINCKENINLKNIKYFEKGLLARPSSNNILKMIYVYNEVGEFEKRDKLLIKYNARYTPQYNLNEVLEMRFY